ncbi:MAG: ribosome recycling factor [Bacteroidia bacterium]|nr:ribosome recycling factor [Bacteroidia bacterium]
MEEVEFLLEEAREQMGKVIKHLEAELLKIRAGRANPTMLDGIYLEYYGTNQPLKNVANINTPDARMLTIQPFEKNMLGPIEKAIFAANLGFTPANDGSMIRINIPPLTEERRQQLVKQSRAEAEHAKVGLRTVRRDCNEEVKKLLKDGLPEDMAKDAEESIQQLTNEFTAKADKHLEAKEKEIMTV